MRSVALCFASERRTGATPKVFLFGVVQPAFSVDYCVFLSRHAGADRAGTDDFSSFVQEIFTEGGRGYVRCPGPAYGSIKSGAASHRNVSPHRRNRNGL